MHFLETDGVEETMAVLNLLAYDEHSRYSTVRDFFVLFL